MITRRAFLYGAVGSAWTGPGSAQRLEALVEVREGTLPIVLSAPHGGRLEIPGVPPRTKGVTVQDSRTDEVARGTADRLEKLLGAKPHLVLAKFHRRFLDANRPESEAFEDPEAREVYLAFHGSLRQRVDEVRQRSPKRGLLLDLHGQTGFPAQVHRGTRNGTTVAALLKRTGLEGLVGPKSICGVLGARGYLVVPATGSGTPPETRGYNGGHIVATYGSHQPDGIDAVQLEIGRELRLDPEKRAKLIVDLAAAIVEFHREFQR